MSTGPWLLAHGCHHGCDCSAVFVLHRAGPSPLSGALDHFHCFDGSLKRRGADYQGCRDHTPQMTPSATDHQVGRDKGVNVEGCDNISRQLSLEQRCGAILTLDFPQVMTSSVCLLLSLKSVFKPPPDVSSPSGRACVILPDWHSAWLGCQLLKSRTLEVNVIFSLRLPQMQICSCSAGRSLHPWLTENCDYGTVHWAQVGCSKYMQM